MHWIRLDNKKKEAISIYLLCLISGTLPFHIKFGNIAIILAVTFNVFFFQKQNFKKLTYFKSWFLVALFVLTALSAWFSKNTTQGLKHLGLTVLTLIIAVIIINANITKEVIYKVLKTMYFSSVLATVILIVISVFKVLNGASLNEITFHGFTMLYDQHPVYYSMYLSLSLFYAFFLPQKKIVKQKALFLLCNTVLIIGLILCASKAVLALNLSVLVPLYIFRVHNKKKKIVFLVSFIVLTALLYNLSFIKERFQDGLRFKESITSFKPTNDFNKKKLFTYDEKEDISDLELRYIFGKISLYHIVEDNKILFGYGQGDTKTYLNYYYYSYNLGPNWYENFNVHNQYLHIIIMYGVLVLLFFMTYIGYSFRTAIFRKDRLQLCFLILTCFVFIFEVVLARNKGIVFFYFFNSLFLFNTETFENSNIRN